MAGHDVWPGCRHRKGDKHGTDDHSRTGRNRGWTQARVDDPRDRSLREEATADHNKRDQGQKDRLEQGLQGDELDMQVVRRVQAHARLRHELRHGQVVQELPPVLPPVPELRGSHVRQARRPALRLQRMHERAHLPPAEEVLRRQGRPGRPRVEAARLAQPRPRLGRDARGSAREPSTATSGRTGWTASMSDGETSPTHALAGHARSRPRRRPTRSAA